MGMSPMNPVLMLQVLLLLICCLQQIHSEQPVAMMHKSYFEFDEVDFDLENENGRERRAAAVPRALTATQANEIVNLHNQFRGGVVPEASNMEFMKWDADLASMALRYSQKCHWGHGNVVNVSPHSSVGQNLWIQGLSSQAKVPNTASAINAWYSEVRNFNFASNSTYECSDPHQCGHYTQLVWATTTSVGCAMSYCPKTTNWVHANSWIMTCYYGPAGNYIGVKPYEKGPSCTKCQSEVGQCSNNMCRLCSEHNEPCDCRQQCVNCGTVDPFSCTCICQDGWYGPDCGTPCNETHPYCNANPGWPGPSYCGRHPMIPKHCPKMCGLCVEPNLNFTCSGVRTTVMPPGLPTAVPPVATIRPSNNTLPPRPAPPAGTNFPPNPPARTLSPNVPVVPSKRPVVPGRGPVVPSKKPVVPFPPVRPTAPRVPFPGPTAVDCKIPCKNGGTQNLVTCTCNCTLAFTGTYCQHDVAQIQNGAMLRLVGDIRNWGMMEYDIHTAIDQSVDTYCNNNVLVCCPTLPPVTPPATGPQLNYLDMINVLTGTGFPEVDSVRSDSYWILLAATEPTQPQLCSNNANNGGAGGAAVEPALLLSGGRHGYRYRRDDDSGSSEEGGPAPVYVDKAIMLNSVDQNIAALTSVLRMYDVTLAEVQRGQPLMSGDASALLHSPLMLCVSLVMFIFTAMFL